MPPSRAALNQGTILRWFCRNWPIGIAKRRPVKAGMAVNMPTSKLVAPKRVRKTGRKGDAAFASPTPTESTCTLRKFLPCASVRPMGSGKSLGNFQKTPGKDELLNEDAPL